MFKLASLTLIVIAFTLTACGGTPPPVDEGPVKVNETDARIARYIDGDVSVANHVPLHSGIEVGQYWELASEQSGVTTTRRWQISHIERNFVVVEYRTRVDGALVEADFVIAFMVDSDRPAPNVRRAWIGKPGEVGKELDVPMSADVGVEPGRSTVEDFTDLEVAGGRWSGKLTTRAGEGWEERTWVAGNGWFHGIVRMESGETLAQLSSFGTNAEPLLDWE
jgi:hypothetical protein